MCKEDGVIKFSAAKADGSDGTEIRMESDGKFFVNGRLVDTDIQVYEGFKQFLADSGYGMLESCEQDKTTVIE